ncbi:hypothetical protein B0H16DRAFT_1711652 [Mycena metata]|uniref:Uncharacterized protein n=1 Tax=Mycena metata TaxID=1033252 RepID=A0AAD7K453_9AGAR|nr:hypothetical protein B0H16DRAFT_1711652 [Mycena metata]
MRAITFADPPLTRAGRCAVANCPPAACVPRGSFTSRFVRPPATRRAETLRSQHLRLISVCWVYLLALLAAHDTASQHTDTEVDILLCRLERQRLRAQPSLCSSGPPPSACHIRTSRNHRRAQFRLAAVVSHAQSFTSALDSALAPPTALTSCSPPLVAMCTPRVGTIHRRVPSALSFPTTRHPARTDWSNFAPALRATSWASWIINLPVCSVSAQVDRPPPSCVRVDQHGCFDLRPLTIIVLAPLAAPTTCLRSRLSSGLARAPCTLRCFCLSLAAVRSSFLHADLPSFSSGYMPTSAGWGTPRRRRMLHLRHLRPVLGRSLVPCCTTAARAAREHCLALQTPPPPSSVYLLALLLPQTRGAALDFMRRGRRDWHLLNLRPLKFPALLVALAPDSFEFFMHRDLTWLFVNRLFEPIHVSPVSFTAAALLPLWVDPPSWPISPSTSSACPPIGFTPETVSRDVEFPTLESLSTHATAMFDSPPTVWASSTPWLRIRAPAYPHALVLRQTRTLGVEISIRA